MLAVAALAFYACEKENNIDNNVEVTHYATISLGKADGTKTMVVEGQDGASYKWNDDDDKYLRVTENGTVGTIESFSLSADKTIATLTVSFTGTPEAPYTYEAKYAGSFSNNGNPKLSAEQTPLSNTFDPSADVLFSKAITSENSRLNELSFTMGRVVTVNKMTLTGLEAGEVISKVEFTLDKVVNGSTSITYHSDSNSYNYSGTKKLTFNYDSTTGVVPADGKFPVYFTAAPVIDAPIISVIVTTDKNVYTKSTSCTPNPFDGKTISFAIGTMKRFNMAMDGYGKTISSGTVYTLVQSQNDLYSGATYIIYGSGHVLGEQKTNNRAAVEVTTENNTITIDSTIPAYPVIIEAVTGGFSIKDINNDGYLYNSNTGKNYLHNRSDLGDDNYTTWTISIDSGVAHINNVGNTARGIMGYNPNNGSPLFAAYGTIPNGGTSDLALYIDLTTAVPDTRAEAGLSWSTDNASASIEDGDIIQFTAPTLSNPNGVSGITYESTETSVATVSAGEVTVLAAGTTTIKAIFAGDTDYKPQTVSYTLTVTDNRTPVATTIADALGAPGTYEVPNVAVYAVKGNALILGDASGKIYAYKSSHSLSVGDVRTVSGSTIWYNSGDVYEFDSPNFSGSGTTTINHGTVVEFADNAATLQTETGFASTGSGAAHTAVYVHAIGDQSGRSITTSNGKVLYLSANESATDGKTVEVYGYIYAYSASHTNFNFLATSIEEYVDPNAKSITALKSSISGVSADGVTNASESGVYSLTNASDSDVTVTPDGTVVTAASISGGALTYTVAANTGSARSGSVTLAVTGGNSISVTISQLAGAGSSNPQTYVDVLTASCFAATSTTYTNFSGKTPGGDNPSSAVYAGNSAKTNSGGIQLRSKNSNSGIVTTTSGGKVKSVKITVESGSNTVDIYGKNSAYTGASDLYSSSTQGTKIGSTSSTGTITVTGDYEYIGIRSYSGALYLTSIEITWEN